MDRGTAITAWRKVCGSDSLMVMPPAGRLLEEFAREIAGLAYEDAATRVVLHCQYPITTEFDRGYDKSRKDAARAILALKDKT